MFIRSIFIDNMIFAYFLGMCSFLAVSKNVKTAFGLGVAGDIRFADIPADNPVYQSVYPSSRSTDRSVKNMRLLISLSRIDNVHSRYRRIGSDSEMVIEKYSPGLYNSLGIFLPLIAVNCAILGAVLFMQQREFTNAWTATVYGAGSGIGWLLAITCLAAIRERLDYSNVPLVAARHRNNSSSSPDSWA